MLEIAESYTIAEQMRKSLVGKIVSEIVVLHSPHKFMWFWGERETFEELLEGKQVTGAKQYGGIIELELETVRVTFSDGAYPRYYDNSKKFPKKHQFMMIFDDDTAISVSVQMYGAVGIFEEGTYDGDYYIGSKEKPSPLDDRFTYAYFKQIYNQSGGKKVSAKAFLGTQQRFPGIGNGTLQDILYHAGLHPKCDMATVSEEELKKLYTCLRDTVKEMCQKGGRDTEKDLFGVEGTYQTWLSKKTVWTPCPQCGYELHKGSYLGGTIYYCEHCQRM
ncbi:endonuclease VIII [Anaerosporobacter faecicola]|uniref:endonuclease VIII n=1 Tax=Anaerosporobacter faecicola TaxID=2718714 RepID=UPI001439C47F|nr:endonuclease VIII [Anaerosporobacter faecicola]